MRKLQSGDVTLAVWESGSPTKPTVVLVHGYPDSHRVWDGVVEALGDAFHVVTYDVRGAGESSIPTRVEAYDLEHLVRDLAAVVDATSPSRPVHLVGHDWGSIQLWEAVTTERLRGRVASFTSISGPSLDHVGHQLRTRLASRDPRQLANVAQQLLSSWYIGAFQLPFLPELAWRRGRVAEGFPAMLAKTEGVIAERSSTRASDGLHGVGLYRANMPERLRRPRERHAHAPVQVIVAKRDRYVRPHLLEGLERWVSDLERREVDAGHWVVIGRAAQIASWIGDYVERIEGRGAARTAAAR